MLSISKLKEVGEELVDYCESDTSASYMDDNCSSWGQRLARLVGGGWAMGGVEAYSSKVMASILDGNDPISGKKVVRLLPNRVAGFDLTFTAPKSVSSIWALSSLSDDETALRSALDQAHHQSVICAIDHMERHVVFTRKGKAGHNLQRYKSHIFGAAYLHGASREGDPNLHSHVLLANIAIRHDGSLGALDAIFILRHKMAAGAVYRTEFASALKGMGFQVERDDKSFKVTGVPSSLVSEWSKRREQIVGELSKKGNCGSRAAELAALNTRPKKAKHSSAELQHRWFIEAKQHGFTTKSIRDMMTGQVCAEPIQMPSHDEIIEVLAKGNPIFDEHEIYTVVAQVAQGITNSEGIEHYVSELMLSNKLVTITTRSGREKFTTPGYVLWERKARDVLESYIAQHASKDEREMELPSVK